MVASVFVFVFAFVFVFLFKFVFVFVFAFVFVLFVVSENSSSKSGSGEQGRSNDEEKLRVGGVERVVVFLRVVRGLFGFALFCVVKLFWFGEDVTGCDVRVVRVVRVVCDVYDVCDDGVSRGVFSSVFSFGIGAVSATRRRRRKPMANGRTESLDIPGHP